MERVKLIAWVPTKPSMEGSQKEFEVPSVERHLSDVSGANSQCNDDAITIRGRRREKLNLLVQAADTANPNFWFSLQDFRIL